MHAGLNNAVSATFLALVVACLGRLLARRPAILHCLWFLVLLKLVTPPLYEVSIPYHRPFRAVEEATRSQIENGLDLAEGPVIEQSVDLSQASIEAMVVELGDSDMNIYADSESRWSAPAELSEWLRVNWMRLIGMTWLAGTVTTLLLSCWRIRRFQLLLSEARPASEEIQDWVDELSSDLGLSRPPGVWWISGKLSPMLWALGRSPRLIIPIDLWKSLDNRQRGTLLVHELAHLRRGDHHVRMFELVVTALYWWNPVVWWVRRALRDVEEQCCDAWVVWAFPDAAKSYAETLLETLDFLHQSDRVEPLLASGFGKVHHLRKRLTMIMNGNTPRSVSLWGALGSLSLAVVLLPFNASWAQTADEPKEVEVIVKTVREPDMSTEETITSKSLAPQLVEDLISTVPDAIQGVQPVVGVIQLDEAAPAKVIVRAEIHQSDTTDDAKPNIHLELQTDGSAFVIEADSLKEAISKLNERVKALSKKSAKSALDKKQAEALDKAVKALADTAKHIDDIKSNSDKKGIEKRLLIRKIESDKKIAIEVHARTQAAGTSRRTRTSRVLAESRRSW